MFRCTARGSRARSAATDRIHDCPGTPQHLARSRSNHQLNAIALVYRPPSPSSVCRLQSSALETSLGDGAAKHLHMLCRRLLGNARRRADSLKSPLAMQWSSAPLWYSTGGPIVLRGLGSFSTLHTPAEDLGSEITVAAHADADGHRSRLPSGNHPRRGSEGTRIDALPPAVPSHPAASSSAPTPRHYRECSCRHG